LSQPHPFEAGLKKHIPAAAVPIFISQAGDKHLHIKIVRERATKLGDYRPPERKGMPHRISVSVGQNPYGFLVTMVHEVAHMVTWEKYQRKVKPHGEEWRQAFRVLMAPYLASDIFPDKLVRALAAYLLQPPATRCADERLMLALREHDPLPNMLLRDLNPGQAFMLKNGRVFRMEHKRRTRYLCTEVESGRKYLVNGLAEVVAV
jgi:SprT protein